jgi:hypothetical protein
MSIEKALGAGGLKARVFAAAMFRVHRFEVLSDPPHGFVVGRCPTTAGRVHALGRDPSHPTIALELNAYLDGSVLRLMNLKERLLGNV